MNITVLTLTARAWTVAALAAGAFIVLSPILGSVVLAEGNSAKKVNLEQSDTVSVDENGTVHLPPMAVPFSSFAGPEARAAFIAAQKKNQLPSSPSSNLNIATVNESNVLQFRRASSEFLKNAVERTKALYSVESTPTTIGGVYTDVITPKDGIAPGNRNRVLINLHGGGFLVGAREISILESLPVASLGKIKVIAVDYRQGPEYRFPAASEDAVAVYRELLKTYKPKNIGIYGCSAGGFLTAETMAWIENVSLPAPGAIGIFCASAGGWGGGDSIYTQQLDGTPNSAGELAPPHPQVGNTAYFSQSDFNDPMVSPLRSSQILAKFPPTLIISSTRDSA
jgi:monoterpene epsilon-lactone hydrolase